MNRRNFALASVHLAIFFTLAAGCGDDADAGFDGGPCAFGACVDVAATDGPAMDSSTFYAGPCATPGSCPESVCGNGMLEAGEQCDDSGTLPGDGCSALCQIEEEPGEPTLLAPAPGSTLLGSTQVFTWSDGGEATRQYDLHVGSTLGGEEFHDTDGLGTTREVEIGGLPVDGSTIYVRLYWTNDEWTTTESNDYMVLAFTEAACAPIPSPLSTITWNALEGPVPEGAETLAGDGSDEQPAIQAIIDAAEDGDVIFFPTPPSFYGLGSPLNVTKAIEMRGAGFGDGSVRDDTAVFGGAEFQTLGNISPMVMVTADNVTIRGLRFVGPGRELSRERDEHGIFVQGSSGRYLRGATIVENDLQRFIGEAIRVRWTEGYILRNNRVNEVGYAGITVQASNYGLITGNRVVDVLGTIVTDEGGLNAYPIAITGTNNPGDLICDHTIMSDNYAENSPGWTGIMDHGGQHTLMMDNHVVDCDFAFAFTGPGNDCLAVNNVADGAPRSAMWNVGRPRVGIIGNVFRNTAELHLSGADMVLTDNRAENNVGDVFAHLGGYGDVTGYEARNDWGVWTTTTDAGAVSWGSGAARPAMPVSLDVSVCGSQTTLRWDYDKAAPHHAFQIESSADGETWRALAFRPPHDGSWDFDTDAHPAWEPLDTRRFSTETSDTMFRIRALHGDAVSDWTLAASP